jgi:hypothetical protein
MALTKIKTGSISDSVTLTSPDINTPDIDGGTADGLVIGGATPAAGSFTDIAASGTVDGRDVATDGTKLDGIEASADVTDTTNVTAAGALMDSELTSIASVKALNQGVATGDSPTFAAVTANGGVVVDTITIDGSEIDASGSLIFDIGGNLTINVDGSVVSLADDSVNFGQLFNSGSGNFNIYSPVSNQDIIFRGNDGGSGIVALTLDMSNAGAATFNSNVISGGGLFALNGDGTYAKGLTIAKSGEQQHYIYSSGATQTNAIGSSAANWVWKQEGGANKMTLSAAGAATFNDDVTADAFLPTTSGAYGSNHVGVHSSGVVLNAATSQTGYIMSAGSAAMTFGPTGATIQLGGFTAANKLDDYEEGTWTPVWNNTGSGSSTTWGKYTKVGDLVYVVGKINGVSTGGTATPTISGLPFTGTDNNDGAARPCAYPEGDYQGLSSTAIPLNVSFRMNGATMVSVCHNGSGATIYTPYTHITGSFEFNFNVTYKAS